MLRLLKVLLVAGALLWAERARAGTVAILRPASDAPALDEAMYRLQGELMAVGLAVAIVERPPARDAGSPAARAWFEGTASERGIDAFIDVVGDETPAAVEVWICERSSPRVCSARVVLDQNANNAAATLAIRAIDVLRSSFLAQELAVDARAPAPAPVRAPPRDEPTASAPATGGEPDARFGVEAGAAVLTSFDGLGPALLPVVRVEWVLGPWLGVQATGAGLGTRPRIETAEGSVDVAQGFALLGMRAGFAARPGIHPLFALSVGALHTGIDSDATAPNVGHRVDRWSFLADGSAGARWNLPERLSLALEAHLQLAQPSVAIHVVDTVVATTGRPNILFTLTAGAWL